MYSSGEKHVLCDGTVKLNEQSEMFERVLAIRMGCHTHKDTSVDVE